MEEFIGLIVVAVTIIGWVTNLVSEEKGAPAKKNRQGANAEKRKKQKQDLQAELDRFLRQTKNKGKDDEDVIEDVEILDEAPPRREQPRPKPRIRKKKSSEQELEEIRAKARRRQREKQQAQQRRSPQPAKREALKDHHLKSSNLGTEVREHVDQHMGAKLSSGQGSVAPLETLSTNSEQPVLAEQIRQSLASAESVRQALIINELLLPPLSRRKRRSL